MPFSEQVKFNNLKPEISDAIKQSCTAFDARYYNIANQVHHIATFSPEPGVEMAKGLSKIIDQTIKDAVSLGCDLSVIGKGIMLGAFRSSPSIRQEAHKTVRLLIFEILESVLKYKGDVKEIIEGIMSAIIIMANEFKLNPAEAMVIAREDILSSTKSLDNKMVDEIKVILSKFSEIP